MRQVGGISESHGGGFQPVSIFRPASQFIKMDVLARLQLAPRSVAAILLMRPECPMVYFIRYSEMDCLRPWFAVRTHMSPQLSLYMKVTSDSHQFHNNFPLNNDAWDILLLEPASMSIGNLEIEE